MTEEKRKVYISFCDIVDDNTPITIEPMLLSRTHMWRRTAQQVYMTLYMWTRGGAYGIKIKVDQLASEAFISVPATYTALSLLIKDGWIIKEKLQKVSGRPNVYYINTQLQNCVTPFVDNKLNLSDLRQE